MNSFGRGRPAESYPRNELAGRPVNPCLIGESM
jgi:hypothetical protein